MLFAMEAATSYTTSKPSAIINLPYQIISTLFHEVKQSHHDAEVLGYALFKGHLNVVEELGKRTEFVNAYIGWFAATRLHSHNLLDKVMDVVGPVNIAILSDRTEVIDYVASKVTINSSTLVYATEYGKITFMKHVYSPDMRVEQRLLALSTAMRSGATSCVDFLLARTPKDKYTVDLVMTALEHTDVKIFDRCFKDAKLKEEDIVTILQEIKKLNYERQLAVISDDTRVTPQILKLVFEPAVQQPPVVSPVTPTVEATVGVTEPVVAQQNNAVELLV